MKKTYITALFLLLAQFLFAQSENDALRFSRLNNYGSARVAAMGGAFGALGGDLSAIGGNPAGVGVFRKSEINFTPLVNFTNNKAGLREAEKNAFQLGNMGFVFSMYNPEHDWRGFNFAFNYTNLNNFNRILDQEVVDSETSLLDVYAYDMNLDYFDYFSNIMAFQTGLIREPNNVTDYYHTVLNQGDLVNQYKYIKEKGYQGEYDLAFGTNYKDKLYLGLTFGIQSFYYTMRSVYSEFAGLDGDLDQFHKYEHRKLSGTGVNLKFGMIYRPIPELRLGAAIHTPTWYNMDFKYTTDMTAHYFEPNPDAGRDELDYASEVYEDARELDMKTPWRAVLSVATILMQKAIISFDYEYVDYSYSKYSNAEDYVDFHQMNQSIGNWYQGAHNFRLGAEYRFNSVLSLRAGYSWAGSPYKESGLNYADDIPGGDKIQSISGGLGLNFGAFYCDAAFNHVYGKDQTVFYYVDSDFMSQPIKNKYKNNQARLSIGVRF